MSKKQLRVSNDNLKQYAGSDQLMNVILKSGSVFLIRVLQIDSEVLIVKNTRGHKLDLPLTQIEEIWVDNTVNA